MNTLVVKNNSGVNLAIIETKFYVIIADDKCDINSKFYLIIRTSILQLIF